MKGVGAVFGIIMIMVSFVIFPLVMTGTDEVLKDPATTTGNVTTGGGVTTGTVTIPNGGLYNDSTDSVTSLTSSHGGDTPATSSYASGTDVLTVSGLAASQTRTLTVAYEYDATTDYTGLGDLVRVGPVLIFITLLLSGVGIVWASFKGKLG